MESKRFQNIIKMICYRNRLCQPALPEGMQKVNMKKGHW